jgi:hypothetical protein
MPSLIEDTSTLNVKPLVTGISKHRGSDRVWIPQLVDVSMIIHKGVNSLSQITFHVVMDTSADRKDGFTRLILCETNQVSPCHGPFEKPDLSTSLHNW